MKTTLEIWPASWLQPSHWQFWRESVAENPGLRHPFFSPELFQALVNTGEHHHAMLFKRHGVLAGILPFEVRSRNRGFLVDERVIGQHGLISPESAPRGIDLRDAVRKAGLRGLRFDQVPTAQNLFAPYPTARDNAPELVLGRSYRALVAEFQAAGRSTFRNIAYKRRRLTRLGEVAFEFDSSSGRLYRYFLREKQARLEQSGLHNPFGNRRNMEMIRNLRADRAGPLRAVLSGLYIDNRPVAAHLGLACNGIFYSWIPATTRLAGAESPGLVLMGQLIEELHRRNYAVFDFGTSPATFKSRLSNSSYTIRRGFIPGELRG